MKLKDISYRLGGRIQAGDPELEIHGIGSIDDAVPGEISFLAKKKYLAALACSGCSAVLAPEGLIPETDKAVILLKNPLLGFAVLLAIFHPAKKETPGISTRSVVCQSASIGEGATIYPLAYVGEGVKIGTGSVIYPGVFIGDNVKIGSGCLVYSNVSIYPETVVGDGVIVHAGAVIGSDGFGYTPDEAGRKHKIPQVGKVVIEDEVEIGANTTIDRATLGETIIRRGVKLDNLIQIAHNCDVGEDSVMAAQTGVAGSSRIGKGAMFGGQSAVSDHVTVGDNVMLAGQSGVASDLEGNRAYAGSPAVDAKVWAKSQMSLPRLSDLIKKVRAMEKRISELEQG